MTPVTLVQFLSFEVAAVLSFNFFKRIIFQGLGIWGWGLSDSRLRELTIDFSDPPPKIRKLFLQIAHAWCDSTT